MSERASERVNHVPPLTSLLSHPSSHALSPLLPSPQVDSSSAIHPKLTIIPLGFSDADDTGGSGDLRNLADVVIRDVQAETVYNGGYLVRGGWGGWWWRGGGWVVGGWWDVRVRGLVRVGSYWFGFIHHTTSSAL